MIHKIKVREQDYEQLFSNKKGHILVHADAAPYVRGDRVEISTNTSTKSIFAVIMDKSSAAGGCMTLSIRQDPS